MQHEMPLLFGTIAKRVINVENSFAVENIQVIAKGEFVNRFYNCSNT